MPEGDFGVTWNTSKNLAGGVHWLYNLNVIIRSFFQGSSLRMENWCSAWSRIDPWQNTATKLFVPHESIILICTIYLFYFKIGRCVHVQWLLFQRIKYFLSKPIIHHSPIFTTEYNFTDYFYKLQWEGSGTVA